MVTDSFERLSRAVVRASVADEWNTAVLEWDVTALEEDPTASGECVCGQQELVLLFTITNRHHGGHLHPIGSTCVQKFGRADLNRQVTLYSDLFRLRSAIIASEPITFDSDYFSRAMLDYFAERGAFNPDVWDFDGGYSFMLKMFNKRNKDAITRAQNAKIFMLLQRKVFPFVLADSSLG